MTGREIWKTKVEYPPETPRVVCCGIINRGAALYEGKIYRTTLDANVIALDAKPARKSGGHEVVGSEGRLLHDGAPLVADGVVIDGHFRRGVRHPRLHRRARSAPTANICGAPIRSAGQDEPGGKTWPGDTGKTRWWATWITGSFDPELHTVYWGIGNPGAVEPAQPQGRQPLHLLGPRASTRRPAT